MNKEYNPDFKNILVIYNTPPNAEEYADLRNFRYSLDKRPITEIVSIFIPVKWIDCRILNFEIKYYY